MHARRILALMLLGLLLIAASAYAYQLTDRQLLKVDVEITAVSPKDMTVTFTSGNTGTPCIITKSTAIIKDGKKISIVQLAVGDKGNALLYKLQGVTYAATINIKTPKPVVYSALGTIASVSASAFTLNTVKTGLTFSVDSNTIITRDGRKVTLSALKSGDLASVSYIKNADNTLLAQSVKAIAAKTFEIEGTITGIDTTTDTISVTAGLNNKAPVKLAVTDSTNISIGNTSAKFTDLVVSDVVYAKFIKNSDGSFTANSITVLPQTVTGKISNVDVTNGILTITPNAAVGTVVSDINLVVTSDTKIMRDEKTAELKDLADGDQVEASYYKWSDRNIAGTIIAKSEDVEKFSGTITSVDLQNNILEVQAPVVSIGPIKPGAILLMKFAITADTAIARNGKPAELKDLLAGDKAEVKYSVNGNTNTAIEVDAVTVNVTVAGSITGVDTINSKVSITNDMVMRPGVVAPVTIAVTGDTVITLDGNTASITDLAIGDRAAAVYTVQDGKNIGIKIAAVSPKPVPLFMYGTVNAVNTANNTFIVTEYVPAGMGRASRLFTFTVTANTQITKNYKIAVLGDLKSGDFAGVGYHMNNVTAIADNVRAVSALQSR